MVTSLKSSQWRMVDLSIFNKPLHLLAPGDNGITFIELTKDKKFRIRGQQWESRLVQSRSGAPEKKPLVPTNKNKIGKSKLTSSGATKLSTFKDTDVELNGHILKFGLRNNKEQPVYTLEDISSYITRKHYYDGDMLRLINDQNDFNPEIHNYVHPGDSVDKFDLYIWGEQIDEQSKHLNG